MTTIVVVEKDGLAALAADSLTSLGEMRMTARYAAGKSKVLKVGEAYVGLSGNTVHRQVLESYFAGLKRPVRLGSPREIFETWRRMHVVLKERYYLNPKDEDSDPYEATQIAGLIASAHGLFGVFSLRDVHQYSRFWAMGSGREYALGALAVLYEMPLGAEEIARRAVEAACEFDKSSGLPLESYTVRKRRGSQPR